jgi:hypothetical protein
MHYSITGSLNKKNELMIAHDRRISDVENKIRLLEEKNAIIVNLITKQNIKAL